MRITKIEDMHADGGWRNLSFLKISTDEGLIGWAEFHEGMAGPGLTSNIRVIAEKVIGLDPRNAGAIGARLYAGTRMAESGANAQATAAIENACLDIKGKAAGLPVCDLFGGRYRDRVPVYWSHCGTYRIRDPKLFEKEAGVAPIRIVEDLVTLGKEVVRRGFKALKTNPILFDGAAPAQHRPGFSGLAGSPELHLTGKVLGAIEDQLAAFREGIGPDTGLLMDLNFNFRPEGFKRIAKAVEKFDMTWLEIDTYLPEALADIRRSTTTPIASLETIYNRRRMLPFLQQQTVDVAIIDPQWVGFMEAYRMAVLADMFDVNVASHDAHGYLSSLMGAHLCAAIPNFRIMEYDVDEVPWMHDIVTVSPQVEDGELVVPTAPGWGSDINEDAVLAHPPKNVGAATWMLDWHRARGAA